MIGLVIVTHGRLAEEFVYAMEHVVGPQPAVAAICIGPTTTWSGGARDILKACGEVDQGEGVILLTDMFGGTPSNLAISVMEQTKAEVIAGLNLPMLIKLASVRGREPLEAASPTPRRPAANTSPWPPTSWPARSERRRRPRASRSSTSGACTPGPRPSSSSWPAQLRRRGQGHPRRPDASTPARSWA